MSEIEKVSLPEDLFLVASDDTKDPDVLHVRNYLKSRGLTKNDMFRWRISATKSGNFKRKTNTRDQHPVLLFLRKNSKKAFTVKEIIKYTGMKKDTIRSMLSILIKEGKVMHRTPYFIAKK